MTEKSSVEEIFFKFLSQYKFDENDLDYSILDKHTVALQTLSNIGNSGINVFDVYKRQVDVYKRQV